MTKSNNNYYSNPALRLKGDWSLGRQIHYLRGNKQSG